MKAISKDTEWHEFSDEEERQIATTKNSHVKAFNK